MHNHFIIDYTYVIIAEYSLKRITYPTINIDGYLAPRYRECTRRNTPLCMAISMNSCESEAGDKSILICAYNNNVWEIKNS